MLPVDEGPTNEACDPVEQPSLRPLYGHELKHFKSKVTKSYHNLLLWFSGCAENCGHHSPVLRLCRPSINHESSTDKSFPDLDNEKLWLPLQLWAVFIVEPPEHVLDKTQKATNPTDLSMSCSKSSSLQSEEIILPASLKSRDPIENAVAYDVQI